MPSERCLSNAAVEYIETQVDSNLHPAFEDPKYRNKIKPNDGLVSGLGTPRITTAGIRGFRSTVCSFLTPSPRTAILYLPTNIPAFIDKFVDERKEKFQEVPDAYLKTPATGKTPSKFVEKTT